jgi:hypothetical protein
VEFTILRRGDARLTLIDLSGKKVAVLLSEVLDPGRYAVAWRHLDLPTGVYFLQLETSQSSIDRQIRIMR